jgi:hypothetical protein
MSLRHWTVSGLRPGDLSALRELARKRAARDPETMQRLQRRGFSRTNRNGMMVLILKGRIALFLRAAISP